MSSGSDSILRCLYPDEPNADWSDVCQHCKRVRARHYNTHCRPDWSDTSNPARFQKRVDLMQLSEGF